MEDLVHITNDMYCSISTESIVVVKDGKRLYNINSVCDLDKRELRLLEPLTDIELRKLATSGKFNTISLEIGSDYAEYAALKVLTLSKDSKVRYIITKSVVVWNYEREIEKLGYDLTNVKEQIFVVPNSVMLLVQLRFNVKTKQVEVVDTDEVDFIFDRRYVRNMRYDKQSRTLYVLAPFDTMWESLKRVSDKVNRIAIESETLLNSPPAVSETYFV